MKSILRFSTVLALAALVGCSQNQQPTAPETADLSQEAAALSLEKSLPKITVPDDYATIQAAVDAATGATKINVKSGTYTEAVVVTKPGLVIGATGAVTLNGGFYLTDAADNVTIRNFTIVPQGTALPPSWPFGGVEFAGIYAFGVTGGKAEDNTVTGGSSFEFGIYYENSTGCTIKGNSVSGTNFGIVLKNSSGNTIDENTVTGTGGPGIQLYADNSGSGTCDNNTISGNRSNSSTGSAGIDFLGTAGKILRKNVVKDNEVKGNYYGITLNGADRTTIGSDNVIMNNANYGIWIASATNTTIKKNTVTNNTPCDILQTSGSGNVLIKNTAGCVSGF